MTEEMTWVLVPGGICRYGDEARPIDVDDLWWTVTSITTGQFGRPEDPRVPITGVSHAEAEQIAARLDGRLPHSVEWEWTAAGPQRRRFPANRRDPCRIRYVK